MAEGDARMGVAAGGAGLALGLVSRVRAGRVEWSRGCRCPELRCRCVPPGPVAPPAPPRGGGASCGEREAAGVGRARAEAERRDFPVTAGQRKQ